MKPEVKKILIYAFLALMLFLSMTVYCFANRGPILDPSTYLKETGQAAIIAWNGKEEIIILSTTLESEKKIKFIEVIPLPSEPEEIKAGELKAFEVILDLFRDKILDLSKA